MAALIRAHDWPGTPLGPIEHWPPSLRTAVDFVLSTRQPAGICWGPDFICLHNDFFASAIGRKRHALTPGIPVRELWPEAFRALKPQLNQVLAGGEPAPSTRQTGAAACEIDCL